MNKSVKRVHLCDKGWKLMNAWSDAYRDLFGIECDDPMFKIARDHADDLYDQFEKHREDCEDCGAE